MWLKAPICEDDKYSGGKSNKKGTPQGGVISPLLANIYLNYVDKIINRHEAFKDISIVRYADDCVSRETNSKLVYAKYMMKDGPSKPVFRKRLQITLCCYSKELW